MERLVSLYFRDFSSRPGQGVRVKYFILSLLCLALGWFAGAEFGGSPSADVATLEAPQVLSGALEVQAQAELVAELQQDLLTKEAKILALEGELDALSASAPVAVASEAAAAEDETAPRNPFWANAHLMAVEMMKSQNQAELEKFKIQLDLTPDQIAALEKFYGQEVERDSVLMKKTMSGDLDMAQVQEEAMSAQEGMEYHTVSELLDAILSAEQHTAYEDFQVKEKAEAREASAYSDLSEMQRQFILDEDQKDAVFEIYYSEDYTLDRDEWAAYELDPQDPEFFLKSQSIENERLLEALSQTLSPEQLEIHRKKLEAELKMQRQAMQMSGGAWGQPAEAE